LSSSSGGLEFAATQPHDGVRLTRPPLEKAVELLQMQLDLAPAFSLALNTLGSESALVKFFVTAHEETQQDEMQFAKFERLKWAFEQIKTCLQWMHQVQRTIARRADVNVTRGVTDFLRKGLTMFQNLKSIKDPDAVHALFGSTAAFAEVLNSLSTFDNACREQLQLVLSRDEMAAVLARDEEHIMHASSSLTHPPLEIGLVQQQLNDDFASLSALVFSRHQQMAVLETRLVDCAVCVFSPLLLLFKNALKLKV